MSSITRDELKQEIDKLEQEVSDSMKNRDSNTIPLVQKTKLLPLLKRKLKTFTHHINIPDTVYIEHIPYIQVNSETFKSITVLIEITSIEHMDHVATGYIFKAHNITNNTSVTEIVPTLQQALKLYNEF